jgi:Ser/Thr protein kinase RdoA (MazF antagonist)
MDIPQSAASGHYPALHSIVDGASLGLLIERDYGLRATGPIHLLQSGLNDHYALRSPQGDFVIRVYRRGWRTNDAVAWELGLIDHVARLGAAVAECLPRLDGRWFAEIQAAEGLRQVALFRHAPGLYTHFGATGRSRISPVYCAEQFGRSMAEFHAAADTYQPRMSRFQLDLDHLLDQPLKAVAQVYAHRQGELDELGQLASRLGQQLGQAGLPALDWGPCHGDMSGGNSTYSDGRVIHFDFDCGGMGWRAYELGVFFWSLSLDGHGDDVWQPFLRGYRSWRLLPSADLAAVPAFAAIRIIWLIGLWCANPLVTGYHKLHDDYLDRELARLRDFCDRVRG